MFSTSLRGFSSEKDIRPFSFSTRPSLLFLRSHFTATYSNHQNGSQRKANVVNTDDRTFRAAAPSSASTTVYEALELCDEDNSACIGEDVSKAIDNASNEIAKAATGMDPADQKAIDDEMIKLDGAECGFKKRLGANSILAAVSMAACAGYAIARWSYF